MKTYIIRRLLLTIPSLFILTILVFSVVRLIPGDTVDAMVAQMETGNNFRAASGRDRETLERIMGLDVPVHVQYLRWIGVLPTPDWRLTGESEFKGLLQGTLGESLYGGGSTIEETVGGRLPVTIQLGVLAIVIGLLIALPVGVYSAIRQDTAADYVGRTVAVFGLATPNFWLATMALLYPALWWGWSPPMELIPFKEDPLGNLRMFLLPALILGTGLAASVMRMTRTMMLEVLRQDYIRTAWSKGLRERVVVMRHAIKNAFIPVVTLVGLQGLSAQYLLGTDQMGRDLLSRLIAGARISVVVGLAATTMNVVVAVLVGGVSGFVGGKFDITVQRFVDAWMSIPSLLILLTVMSIVGRDFFRSSQSWAYQEVSAAREWSEVRLSVQKKTCIFRRRRRLGRRDGGRSSAMFCPISSRP